MLNKTRVAAFLLAAGASLAQDASQLNKEDARLNQLYAQRVAQLRSDSVALAALRSQERDWIKQRDAQCGKNLACLTQSTKIQADLLSDQVARGQTAAEHGQRPNAHLSPIPQELWGKWTIQKHLSTPGITCWDEKQAQTLLGTQIEYRADAFVWKNKPVSNLGSKTTMVKQGQFAEDHTASGGSVTFRELGIAASAVRQIEIQHPDTTPFEKSLACCTAVPGETVLMKDPDTLIFDECGIFYQASRKTGSPK